VAKKTEDQQMQWIEDHANDLEILLDSPGWKALSEKALEDITGAMETVFTPNANVTMENFHYARGYVAALKNLLAFPSGAVHAAREAERADDEKVERRGRAVKLVSE
jgi:hypothetical protein